MTLLPLATPQPGWIGFSYTSSFVARAIKYGQRWVKLDQYPDVDHTFIATSELMTIGAMPSGVVEVPLSDYLADPDCHVYFRVPRWYDPELGQRIVESARKRLGAQYAYGLFAALAARDTVLGHYLDKIRFVRDAMTYLVGNRLLGWPFHFVCSELAATCLNDDPKFANLGTLKGDLFLIPPQGMFQDEEIFTPEIYTQTGTTTK